MELIQGEYIKIKQYLNKKKQCVSFEFAIPFVEEGQTFREINRFLDESKRLAHFKNHLFDRELVSKQNIHVFISEKICSKELTHAIADIFGTVNTVDLGVKNRYKTPIGFVAYVGQEDDKHV